MSETKQNFRYWFDDGFLNVPNHQHTSQRILPDLRVHEFEHQVNILRLLILDPFPQIASGKDNIILNPSNLSRHNLESGLAQVQSEGIEDLLFSVLDAGWVEQDELSTIAHIHGCPHPYMNK